QVSTLSFKLDPSLFTGAKKDKIVVGIDIAPATQSTASTPSNIPAATFKPQIQSVVDSSGRFIPVQHTRYDRKIAKANHLTNVPPSDVLVTLKVPPSGQEVQTYSLQIKGLQGSTGNYLVGFYLPGDTNGDGTVNNTDTTGIQTLRGDNATNKNYNFDAD